MKFVMGSFTVIISAAGSCVFHIFSDFSYIYIYNIYIYILNLLDVSSLICWAGRVHETHSRQVAATKISSLLDQQCTTELHPKLVCLYGSLMIFNDLYGLLRRNIPTWHPTTTSPSLWALGCLCSRSRHGTAAVSGNPCVKEHQCCQAHGSSVFILLDIQIWVFDGICHERDQKTHEKWVDFQKCF